MGTLLPVDRVGGIVPVSRRDHPQIPVANDGPHQRHPPTGKGPRDERREAPLEPESRDAPAAESDIASDTTPDIAPTSPFGRVVNTFAGPRYPSSSALML